MVKEKHYLEVGSDDVPSRARIENSVVTTNEEQPTSTSPSMPNQVSDISVSNKKKDNVETFNAMPDEVVSGYDHSKAFVGIDYKGDRKESEWRSVGERLSGLVWRLLLFVAIIAWFIFQAVTCDRAPIYIINP